MLLAGTEFTRRFREKWGELIRKRPAYMRTALQWLLEHVERLQQVEYPEGPPGMIRAFWHITRGPNLAEQETRGRSWMMGFFAMVCGNGGLFSRLDICPETPLDAQETHPMGPANETKEDSASFLDATMMGDVTRSELRDVGRLRGPLFTSERAIEGAAWYRVIREPSPRVTAFTQGATRAGIEDRDARRFLCDLFWADVHRIMQVVNEPWGPTLPVRRVIPPHGALGPVPRCQHGSPTDPCHAWGFGQDVTAFSPALDTGARSHSGRPQAMLRAVLAALQTRNGHIPSAGGRGCGDYDCCFSPGEAWFLKFEQARHQVQFARLLTRHERTTGEFVVIDELLLHTLPGYGGIYGKTGIIPETIRRP